jgi:hypothetical protein
VTSGVGACQHCAGQKLKLMMYVEVFSAAAHACNIAANMHVRNVLHPSDAPQLIHTPAVAS